LIGDKAPGLVDGPREVALVNNPVNVVMAPNGSLFVADFDNGVVREVTPEGVTTTLIQQAGFSRPFGMAVTPSGTLFVQTDRSSTGAATGALWKVAPGSGVASLEFDDVGRVRGLASLSDGRLILADVFAHTLRIYNPATGSESPLAGLSNTPGYADGTGQAARFNSPLDVVIGSGNQIFVADSQNHRIRQVTLGGAVTTIAGSGTQDSTNGPMLTASFDTPVGLALDGDAIFVSEYWSGKIRKAAAGSVTTIAGSTPGFADHADPMLARLNVSEGLAFEAPFLYIADGNRGTDAPFHRVRRLDLGD
jgi:sugar lactone lactonase YvrE